MEALCGVQNHALNNLLAFPEMQEGGEGRLATLVGKTSAEQQHLHTSVYKTTK
jgi:hypothetical protein